MGKKFSLIIPAYNAEKTIDRCIKSVLKQTYKNYELIVVNDGSKDGTKKICDKYCNKDNVVIINQKNRGVSYSRNVGIKNASGKYIIFIDSDDYIDEKMLEIYDDITKNEPIDLIISNIVLTTELENLICYNKKIKSGNITKKYIKDNINLLYKIGMLNSPCSRCYLKEKIVHLFDCNISLGEDLLFNLNFIKKINKIYYTDNVLYYYVKENNNSLSSKYRENGLQILTNVYYQTITILKELFGENVELYAVRNKYVLDSIVMAERLALSNKTYLNKIRELREYFKEFDIRYVGKMGKKWNIYYRLLTNNLYVLFILFAKIIKKIKG